MSTADLIARTVMDASAVLLNDQKKQNYTYVVQIPYLNLALQELQEIFELNEIPVTSAKSAVINIPQGYDHIAFNNGSNPTLPNDLIEPSILWERAEGISPYVPMIPVNSLRLNEDGILVSQFRVYVWESQEIRFLPASRDNDIKMDYIRNLFVPAVDENSQINIINAASFLEYRCAALCAEFIGENPTRAQVLNNDAGIAIDRVTGIGSKGRQNIITRRRPFRSGRKIRGGR